MCSYAVVWRRILGASLYRNYVEDLMLADLGTDASGLALVRYWKHGQPYCLEARGGSGGGGVLATADADVRRVAWRLCVRCS